MKQMLLRWGKRALNVVDPQGRKVAFDPSIESPGPTALLCLLKPLEEFLDQQKLKLFWRVASEKLIIEKKRDSKTWPGIQLRHRQAVHTTVGPTHEIFPNESS